MRREDENWLREQLGGLYGPDPDESPVTTCYRVQCWGQVWISEVVTPKGEEILVRCCDECGEMSVVPESQRNEALGAARLLQEDRDAGGFDYSGEEIDPGWSN